MAELAPINHFPYMWYKKGLLAIVVPFRMTQQTQHETKIPFKTHKRSRPHTVYQRGNRGMFTFFYLLHMKGGRSSPPPFPPNFYCYSLSALGGTEEKFLSFPFYGLSLRVTKYTVCVCFCARKKKVGGDCARAVKTYFEPAYLTL